MNPTDPLAMSTKVPISDNLSTVPILDRSSQILGFISGFNTPTRSLQEEYTYQKVWDKLSLIDVKDHIKKKNNLSYLSWAWAWGVMMENYPELEYEFSSDQHHPDKSCTVHCEVRIGNLARSMWLPVMTGFKNTAVNSPDSRDIGDAKMRCLVKAFAMFGLGHYIYAGEDLPQDNERTRTTKGKAKTAAKSDSFIASSESIPQKETKGANEPKSAREPEKTSDPKSDGIPDLNRLIMETFSVFLPDCDSIDELHHFWTSNKEALKKLEKSSPSQYNEVLESFKAKKISISSNK